MLSNLIPQEQSLYNATLAESLAEHPRRSAKTAGLAVGDTVAAGILAWRANDGSNAQVPYVPGTAPGQWRPTPPDYSVAWGPEWGQVTPFAIPSTAAVPAAPAPRVEQPRVRGGPEGDRIAGGEEQHDADPQRDADRRFLGLRRRGHGAPSGPLLPDRAGHRAPAA